jgi:hypothetical protein
MGLLSRMMGVEKEIKKTSSMQTKLDEQVNKTTPLVLQDFNFYVRHTINLTLPYGYNLLESQKADYIKGSFFIIPGKYQTLNGRKVTPEIEARVSSLFRSYEETHPNRFVVEGE